MSVKITVRIEKDEASGEYYIPRECFDGLVDYDSIDTYEIKELEDGSISIALFDKDGNVMLPKQDINE